MNCYLVTWQIDIEAETPRDAARAALAIQHNTLSIATVFDVTDRKSNATTTIDLGEPGIKAGRDSN